MTDTQTTATDIANFDPFDNLNFATQPDELPPYLGIIMQDSRSHNVFNDQVQHQWVYAIRPVDLRAKAFYGYIKFSTSRNSVCMKVKDAFVGVLGKINPDTGKPYNLGTGELVGKVMWFQQKSYDFGPNMSPSKPVPVPVRVATPEEIERAQSLPEYVPAATGDDSGAQATSWTPNASDIQDALNLYDGRDHKDVVKAVVKGINGMSADLTSAIQSGRMLNYLVEQGLVAKDDAGVIHVRAGAAV